jgi:hypothetical protein
VSTTAILFSPDDVRRVLAAAPSVAALVPDPADEGLPTEAFAELRKTERELYRWIANTHFEHLATAVVQLEEVHAAGVTFEQLLKTRSRDQFVSLTTEMFVAHDLLRRGYDVTTIPRSRESSPDLHVRGDGVDLVLEVYSPRELLAVDAWLHEVGDLLNYVDIAASYDWRIATDFSIAGAPEHLKHDPWAPQKMLESTRAAVIADIARDVEDALGELRPLEAEYRHAATSMVTKLEVTNVRSAAAIGPMRHGTFSYPGFSGYLPAGIFRKIVERARSKASRRQVEGVPGATRGLVVYLMGTKIAEDLAHRAHLEQAAEALDELEPADYGLDVIAFVVRALPHGLAALFTVADDATLTREQVEALFHQWL